MDEPIRENSAGPASAKPRVKSKLLMILVALAMGVPAGFLSARMIRIPRVETLDNYRPSVITRIYARDGRVFADYAIQRRIIIPKREMAPALVQAIIATEDANFYKHGGIDARAIARAAVKDIIAMKKVEGASTLTQQLAKQLFLTPEKKFSRKINEAFLAVEIEKQFTKDQIFEFYANQVYLGHGAYGVEAAARLYFGKNAKQLTIPEAAVLAGLIRRPMYYTPINNPSASRSRRNHVLRRMLERKYISRDEYVRGLDTPIVLGTYKEDAPRVGPYFAEEIRQYLEKNYGTEDLYRGGLKVLTSMDLQMQEAAEKALQKGLRQIDQRRGFRKPARNVIVEGIDPEKYTDPSWTETAVAGKLYPAVVLEVARRGVRVRLGKEKIDLAPASWAWTRKPDLVKSLKRGDIVQLRFETDTKTGARSWRLEQLPQVQGAVVVLDVKSSEVRAMVGGYDFRISKFNRAVQSVRQTGSAFKPLIYAAAFEKGLTPGDTLFDAPIAIRVGNQIYAPRNYYGKYSGIVTIQRALELSINVPAVKAYMMVGGDKVVDLAQRCGITAKLPKYPSLALGAGGVSPLEMTGAYNVFANQGVFIKPRLLRKITDATDKVLEESYPELSEAMSAQVAYLTTHVMQGTIDRGTAYAAHKLPGALAGKTGTTNGFTDAWFIGYSPEYSIGVWIGYDDPSRSLGGGSTGGDVALPIWMDIFEEIDRLKLRPGVKEKFEAPAGIVFVPMDLKTGRRGSGPCGKVVEEAFIAGTEPERDCSGAAVAVSKLPFYLQRPFYQPKESEPNQPISDVTAQPGEGGESPEAVKPESGQPPPLEGEPPVTSSSPSG